MESTDEISLNSRQSLLHESPPSSLAVQVSVPAAGKQKIRVEGLRVDHPHGRVGFHRQRKALPRLAGVLRAHHHARPARGRVPQGQENGLRVPRLHLDSPRVRQGKVFPRSRRAPRLPAVGARPYVVINHDHHRLGRSRGHRYVMHVQVGNGIV